VSKVIDLDLQGLPSSIKEEDLKKIAGVKHVINTTIESDSIRNVCTGTGRIKLRLQPEESSETVMLNFVKAGYAVQEHSENPKKKTGFTTEMTLQDKPKAKLEMDSKQAAFNMQNANCTETFGNSPVNPMAKRGQDN
jgi:hypothetical protein